MLKSDHSKFENQKFLKSERLCSKTIIKQLVSSDKKIINYPYLLKWITVDSNENIPVKILISVPKRKINKAVDRNYIKRLIRESYRKNKHLIFTPLVENKKNLAISIIYLGKEMPDYNSTYQKISTLLEQLAQQSL